MPATSLFPRHGSSGVTEDMTMSGSSSSMSSSTTTTTTMSSSMMNMVFFNAHTTPLFSDSFSPSTRGQYAGVCIFIIVLAIVGRMLVAGKARLEARWEDQARKRMYVTVAGQQGLAESIAKNNSSRDLVISENGVEQNVKVLERQGPIVQPFRMSVDPVRALIDMVIAGVGYLLMLAVMTMNIGYFCSVLAGIFLGTLMVGRFMGPGDHSH
ncbi:hypothetical protein TD95_004994 [Thielaviopsis punctulata]|uniref:Copper transport protein n=1 Tax=Thielaviopsis punctulata TaxID=72032 RepID=A0A0F4Z8Q9_9PEZI|nr:hypothetical protein TD95_004994 [Thielaviopsis punctulata]